MTTIEHIMCKTEDFEVGDLVAVMGDDYIVSGHFPERHREFRITAIDGSDKMWISSEDLTEYNLSAPFEE